MIEEKMGIRLWWSPGDLLAPLESRGAFRFDMGLHSPRPVWNQKIYYTTFKCDSPKYFMVILDLDKQT